MGYEFACPSRRQFLAAALGAGTLLPAVAAAAAPFRIDVHHHVFPRQIMDLQERLNPEWGHLAAPHPFEDWRAATMLAEMDRNGVAAAIVSSAAPGAWFGAPAPARQISRAWNEYAAGLKRAHRGRIGFFALIALPDVEGALKEIEYACDTLKADGIGLYSSYGKQYPGDAAFAPVFDELNRRSSVVFIHPIAPNCCTGVQPGIPLNIAEFPFDTTRAILSLLFSGTFSRCPDIRYIFPHGGGTLPMLAGRIDELTRDQPKLRSKLPRGVAYELKRLYVDTAGASSAASLAAVRTYLPQAQILYGSDFPYLASATTIAELRTAGVSARGLRAIERDNAQALFARLKT